MTPFFDIIKCCSLGIQEIIKFYYFGNSLLSAHPTTIYTLAVNTTGGTPEKNASMHVTLVGTTILFSVNNRKFNCFYTISTHILIQGL